MEFPKKVGVWTLKHSSETSAMYYLDQTLCSVNPDFIGFGTCIPIGVEMFRRKVTSIEESLAILESVTSREKIMKLRKTTEVKKDVQN